MPELSGPRALFARLATDLAAAESALGAEMMLSTMLGVVYGMAEADRATAVADFTGGLRRFAAEVDAPALAAAVAALSPGEVPPAFPPDVLEPPWLATIGRVRCTGTFAYGDIYGDQVSYLAAFEYDDPDAGGPDHTVVALVDHNLGFLKDMFVAVPAGLVLASVESMAAEDPSIWLRPIDSAELRGAVTRHLAYTDGLADLPESDSLRADRAIAVARLALLPAPTQPAEREPLSAKDRSALIKAFRASVPGKSLPIDSDAERASLRVCLNLIVDWAGDHRDGEPLRWSPTSVELFLLDWLPRRVVLDKTDVTLLPIVLDAWVRWAGRRRKLPAQAMADTRDTIVDLSEEFTQRARVR